MLDPRHLDLENMSNLHYFVFGWLPSLDALDIAYLPDPYVLNNQRKKNKKLNKKLTHHYILSKTNLELVC
jgi:hypothetical protein